MYYRFFSRYLLAVGAGCCFILTARAQASHNTARVVDASSGQPIPYASIGVCNRPLGTVADAQGSFLLSRIGAADTDTLVISCVGYVSRKLLAKQLPSETTLRLIPQTTKLADVVVRGRKPKRILLGHNWVSAFTMLGFYTQADTVPHIRLGRELGPVLKIKHPTQLESFHLFTSGRGFKTVTFRLNIYAMQDGEPQHSLLRQDIIFTVNGQQRAWTEIDLRPYNILLAGPQEIVATAQWLASEAGRPNSLFLDIPTHLSAFHTTFRRDKSGQVWTKIGGNPSFYFSALSYPE